MLLAALTACASSRDVEADLEGGGGLLSAADAPPVGPTGPDEALSVEVDARGATLTTFGGSLQVGFRRLGRASELADLATGGTPRLRDHHASISRGALTEWWATHRRGVELGATITRAPEGEGVVVAELEVAGMPAFGDTGSRVSFEANDGTRLHLDTLVVTDATQRRLPARMLGLGDTVRFEVDDHAARYPITIDPVFYVETQVIGRRYLGPYFTGGVTMSADGSIVVAAIATREELAPRQVDGLMDLRRVDGRYVLRGTVLIPSPAVMPGVSLEVLAMNAAGDVVLVPGASQTLVFRRRSCDGMLAYDASLPIAGAPSLSSDGRRALVGGTVYAFDGSRWSLEAELRTGVTVRGEIARDGASALFGWTEGFESGVVLHRRGASGWDSGSSLALPRTHLPHDVGSWEWGWGFDSSADEWIVTTLVDGVQGAAAIVDVEPLALDTLFPPPAGPPSCGVEREGGVTPFLSADGARAVYRFRCGNVSGVEQDRFLEVVARDAAGWSREAQLSLSHGTRTFDTSEAYSSDASWIAAASFRAADSFGDHYPRLEIHHREPCDATCTSGFCVDGVCCDTACGDGLPDDCQACSIARGAPSDGVCTVLATSHVCRPDVGVCDSGPESCDGTSPTCPPDEQFLPGMEPICRPSRSACDFPERCAADGTCPPDTCDDGDECTAEGCDVTGCTHARILGCCRTTSDCDDGDPCTWDTCEGLSGCVHDDVCVDAGAPIDVGSVCLDASAEPLPDAASADGGVPEEPVDASAAPDATAGGETPGGCSIGIRGVHGERDPRTLLGLLGCLAVLARSRRLARRRSRVTPSM